MPVPAELLDSANKQIDPDDALFLLGFLLELPRHELLASGDEVPAAQVDRFGRWVDRVALGEPPQYITGRAPFLDFELRVDPRVLIPRPETEELVGRVLSRIADPRLVLDFGTGSGCIAVAFLRRFPKCRVIGVDVSGDALDVARDNAAVLGVKDRFEAIEASDLSGPRFRELEGRLDLLVSNPPYIPTERIPNLAPRVRDHEPVAGLDGGPQGTNILAMLLEQGPRLLKATGLLACEIDETQPEALCRLAPGATIENDLAARSRFLFLEKEAS